MIQILGARRAAIIGVMLVLNLIIGGSYMWVVEPMKTDTNNRLTSVQAEIGKYQSDIQNIKVEMQTLKDTLPDYQALSQKGFFRGHDRFEVERLIKDLGPRAGVYPYDYEVDQLKVIETPEATAVGKRIFLSRIKISRVSSPTDVGFYNLLQSVPSAFPEHVRIASFELKTSSSVSDAISKKIVLKEDLRPYEGSLTIDWMTLVDMPEAPADAVPGGM